MRMLMPLAIVVMLFWGGSTLLKLKSGSVDLARAEIVEGMQRSMMVRQYTSVFFAETGRLPSSNEELGIPPATDFAHNALAGIEVARNGTIMIRYNQKAGVDYGLIRLVPDTSDPVFGLQWDCVTSTFPGIATVLSSCRYEAPPGAG